jgi:hypothetical protein
VKEEEEEEAFLSRKRKANERKICWKIGEKICMRVENCDILSKGMEIFLNKFF